MNLRNVESYDIGLDIGTASVGWAVTETDSGDLCHFGGKPTWGSRLVPEASKAAEARVHRGQRRRYGRRRWRLDLLQELFCEEVSKVDPEFFVRLKQSRLLQEDRDSAHADYAWPLFNDEGFDERSYYEAFPTIYHLRAWLMQTEEKADIRLIYLAFHNIVKHRGNFLQQDNKALTARNASVDDAVSALCEALQTWCECHDVDCTAFDHVEEICDALKQERMGKGALRDAIAPLLGVLPGEVLDKRAATSLAKSVAGAIVGAKADMAHVLFVFDEKPEDVVTSIYLSNDEQVEAFEDSCPDDGLDLFEAMQRVYASFVLQGILSSAPGETISTNKIAEYEKYGQDLKVLKALVRQYVPASYDEFFRGPLFEKAHPKDKHRYNVAEAKGYTRYNLVRKASYEDFRKEVKALFEKTDAVQDPRYAQMMSDFEDERFLRRLKTSDNGSIPYQLHLEEMDGIIENQARFYPFLATEKKKLDSLVSFRIPYYVGPLTQKNARRVGDAEDGDLRFAWAERLPGKESAKIYPWNWEEVIDKNASAERFIRRMTGTCTYLQGEPVLPKSSLLYEEFCVLNELNGAHYTQDGDRSYRFDYRDRADMMDELFRNGSVAYKKVEDWMARRGHMGVRVSGGQGERGFESRLSSYLFFKKDVFGVDELPDSDYPMIEEIILWSTLFEDRDILRQKLEEKYSDRLSAQQMKTICRKRFTGWGRLSARFLTQIKAQTDDGERSIMDVLREGDPNNGHGLRAMVLMEALRDDKLRFQELVDAVNAKRFGDVAKMSLDEIPGSPALRRGINQALRIVEEIVGIAGHAPKRIFVEVTRSDDDQKGVRTKRRYDALKEHLAKLKENNPEFWTEQLKDELAHVSHGDLGERLTLYFMQGGKSLYSGKPLRIEELSKYEIDHILPQSYIKDDSFENKALVFKEENQRKSDQMLLPSALRREMRTYWDALFGAGLIGEKKHRNLLRDEISDRQMKGFINRQIVETSQVAKIVQMMLRGMLPETEVMPVKAGLSSELRDVAGLVKCREVNDFHHAHDALLACEIGRFIMARFPDMYENPLKYQHMMRSFVKAESDQVKRGNPPYRSAFIISSFMKSGFDEETGEILRDTWNADAELGKIRRYLNYRQCYVTHMPEETSGAFWDETIYSPRDPKKGGKLRLPLKKGLDPTKYGSYSSEQFAYFFIYKALKNGKPSFVFAPVPVNIAASLAVDEGALSRYARQLASWDGAEFVEVVRRKIYKYQLIEVEGSRLYITGKKEVRNGMQVALDQQGVSIAKRIVQEMEDKPCEPATEEEVALLFDKVKRSLEEYSPRLVHAIKLGSWDDRFVRASLEDKKQVVMGLFAIAAAKTNMVDLRAVGEGKSSVACNRAFQNCSIPPASFSSISP